MTEEKMSEAGLRDMLGLPIHVVDPFPQAEPSGAGRSLRPAKGAVYLAGPVTGLTYTQARYGWRKYVAQRLLPGIAPLSPMRHEHATFSEIAAEDPEFFRQRAKAIFNKDMLDIRRSDVVLVNLLGTTQCAKGSLVEIGAAWALGKFIVVVVEPGTLHDYPFVTEPAGAVVTSLDDAIDMINSLLSEGI